MKQKVVELLSSVLKGKIKKQEIENLIEVPPQEHLGDFAFPCFSLAKVEKKSPLLIAEELVEKLRKKLGKEISNVDFKTGYVNFFVDKKLLGEKVLKSVGKVGDVGKGKKIMVEFPSPNTNKPLHLGHLRNMAIGESVSRILELVGNKVIRSNINNDRGIHICKSIVAYEKFGKGKTPNSENVKSDHFVGDYYVLFNEKVKKDKSLEKEAQDCLRKWEAGDKKTIALWKKMNKWAFDGWKETYGVYGVKHDKEYYESDIYTKGREIIESGLKKGLFEKGKDGEIKINLEKENLGEKVLLRSDGTSVYMTQDLYLAKKKDDDFHLDGSIYVVGNEQNYHFKVLFSILKKLNFKFANNLYHLSYGMVELPEGKIKSREGKKADADDLISETCELAKEELKKRYKLSKKEESERALKIALAAIKYSLLKVNTYQNMIFNPKEALAFEGDTGPYLLYSYARALSILKKVKKKKSKMQIFDLNEKESKLLKKISNFNSVVENAYEKLSPNLIANYCYELARDFNEFYHSSPVLGSKEEVFRLKLVEAFRVVMKKGLNLLGIEEVEEM